MRFDYRRTTEKDPPGTETLRTIVESEGARVNVTRYVSRPALHVNVVLKSETYSSDFDIEESEIADTASAVAFVAEQVRERSYQMRLAVLDDLLECGMRLDTEKGRKAFVGLLDDGKLDQADMEQLALELMTHVERIGR
jgi:hypothetical protein